MSQFGRSVGELLRQWRVVSGKSLTQVSTETGIDAASLSKIECGKRDPSMRHVDTLFELYGIGGLWEFLQPPDKEQP